MAITLFHILLLLASFFLLLPPTNSTAQSIPFDYAVESSVGMSRLRWPGDLPRTSYLPTVTVNAAATSTSFKKFYLQPFAGLQFDGVGFDSPVDRIDYQDHYAVLAFRTGLFIMLRDTRERKNRLILGLGLETQRPLYVSGSVYSQVSKEKRVWVRVPDPPELEQWGLYWSMRIGIDRRRFIYALDLTLANNQGTMLPAVIPKNALFYTSLRFSVLTRFSTSNQ